MKIQFLNGGLANQTFQYIFSRYYELSHPGEIMYLDDSYFAQNTVHNGYELEKVYGVKPHMLSECFDADVWEYMLSERRNGKSIPQIFCESGSQMYMISEVGGEHKNFNPFDGTVCTIPCNDYIPRVMDARGDVYYHGYWLNRKWFDTYKEVFWKELSFPELSDEKNRQYMNAIQSTNSLAVHIRRGDFVKLGFAFDENTYRYMIDNFILRYTADWEVFVFSDDIAWCRGNMDALGLRLFRTVHFVEGNVDGKNYIDLQLMSCCKGMIMSNSSFSFLAALLNQNAKVVYNLTTREF